MAATDRAADATAVDILVCGIVQGVGFRPCVWRIAHEKGLMGWVNNASDGVHIHLEGDAKVLDDFRTLLLQSAPPQSRIDSITVTPSSVKNFETFEIWESDELETTATLVSPDIATCPQCLHELFDPRNRRYHYPFINCTQCGPRFTIIDALPYDRPATSMSSFEMCPSCTQEYLDPADRRFHAQPNACFECGPLLTWTPIRADFADTNTVLDNNSSQLICNKVAHNRAFSDKLIAQATDLLLAGGILALKGLGGYHLACDATNEQAVATLRTRKQRPHKPFALMVADVEDARALCQIDATEEALLSGAVRPIVLLRRKPASASSIALAKNVVGSLPEVGIMLPYTPLQHLLMAAVQRPLVMTSGNLSEEPILALDDEAHEFLSPIADAFLGNNRPIRSRYDDSVVRVHDGILAPVRRARGYAPTPLALPASLVSQSAAKNTCVLACGPEQKNTFCLTRGSKAFVSQHLGDLENKLSFDAWVETIALYERLFDLHPTVLACDMHPEYLSTKWAHEQQTSSAQDSSPLFEIQHHHAHVAAVTGEHNMSEPVIGIALDGTGLGPDGTIWGGEILLCDWRDCTRKAHLSYLPLPGGAAAVRDPRKMALGMLQTYGLESHPGALILRESMTQEEWQITSTMVKRNLNCPRTSSAGRLLDAIAALCGICTQASYDGEPAIALEAALYREPSHEDDIPNRYGFTLDHEDDASSDVTCINPQAAIVATLDDLAHGCSPNLIAQRFHRAFACAIVNTSKQVAHESGCDTVALAGGVFMNRFLLTHIRTGLEDCGLRVLTGTELPSNDGSISFGQAIIALARMQDERTTKV